MKSRWKKYLLYAGADLRNANLTGTNLTAAKIAAEQLTVAKTLQGATMPDGSKHL
jgi:uncharacterized protein YjbI with pentapeptide repeats